MNRTLFFLFSSLLLADSLHACAVPVFRYALELWPADSYRIEIVHSDPLTGEAKAATDLLAGYERDETLTINCRLISAGSPGEATEAGPSNARPMVKVYQPSDAADSQPIWTGPLNRQSVEKIAGSPAGREVVRLLGTGVSSVWLFLPCGDAQRDSESLRVLKNELDGLREKIELPSDPMAGTWDGAELGQGPSVDISYSVVPIDRADPAEEFLIQSLLHVEPGLTDLQDKPMAFPVFGRGRVLYALVGKGINPDIIREACDFIAGPCSCLVKDLNPGTDLLLRADWEGTIGDTMLTDSPPRALVGVGSLLASNVGAAGRIETATSEPSESTSPIDLAVDSRATTRSPADGENEDNRLIATVLIVLGLCAAIVGVGLLGISRWKGYNR